ncbi:hypothetical protein CUJ84_Chr002183 [Rhizobium leguminosarum]|uniref:Uncharacterized protein n=1 Tax=Rhizobium leguminosarum TaxID=384 RepID=A0A2K9Z2T6_RHILE|nr:hypothetical protein CUJ84_Chr002183 [Rhizobium leguminosarum]
MSMEFVQLLGRLLGSLPFRRRMVERVSTHRWGGVNKREDGKFVGTARPRGTPTARKPSVSEENRIAERMD